ncbi:MAG: aminotransferase class V-fold PLP-dependent enzyme [Bifidobacteriaceae bacterium]|jgi:cysteine desulfurase/selenocysteine lyase|nr:aminotransferase class V-fold PLP-dependent enzyme [Bifidobacteriaceae bacterium]
MPETRAHAEMPGELSSSGFAELSEVLRGDFPLLDQVGPDGQQLVYLDTAATSLRPRAVLEAVHRFDETCGAAVHRGTHWLAERATAVYEQARTAVAEFLGAEANQFVTTSGTTAALNLAALLFERAELIPAGSKIVATEAEHHSNLLPWQALAQRLGAQFDWIEVTQDGQLDLNQLDKIDQRTKLVAFTHASNVTGALSDVEQLVSQASRYGAWTVLDAAQSAAHQPFNFAALGVDLAACSAHKMLGPTGVGCLLGRSELLQVLPPAVLGGGMVEVVTKTGASYQPPPQRFEAGTAPVAQLVGWAAALDYLGQWGTARLAEREQLLTNYLLDAVTQLPGVQILGPAAGLVSRLGVVSVVVDSVHPHDVGQYLSARGIAVRVGHHCAIPLHHALGAVASTRASIGPYTTVAELDRFVEALGQVRAYFGVDQ